VRATPERLHKCLARAGFGARRVIERWIAAGRVSVNGRVATVGASVKRGDRVRVDGRVVPASRLFPAAAEILGLNKPVGMICTRRDPQSRPTVFELLPPPQRGRWVSVGRLDADSSGLLLLTTDGELAHRLMHPSFEIEREYAVRIHGRLDAQQLASLRTGVALDDGLARVESIDAGTGRGANRWHRVVLREGRYREVRRLFEALGVSVNRLIRIRYGPIALPRGLRAGAWWLLDAAQSAALKRAAKLASS
jgi:23S rRNA pseudouridine2605 synthase